MAPERSAGSADSAPPEWKSDREARIEEVVAGYVERLNAGEEVHPEEVLAQHPDLASEVLDHLQCFLDFTPGSDGNESLGTLGDYTLRRQIGRGGMGVVYEAWEGSIGRSVALKVLPAGIAADPRASARFLREAQAAGRLSHPSVVSVYAMGVNQNTPWYAMELVEGETLAQVLMRMREAKPDAMTPFGFPREDVAYYSTVARVFADVADGLQHAHAKGVVHRDIKPSNLILDRKGRLRILDFGLARLEGQEALTVSGDWLGTPLYMSPEQARRSKIPVNHRTDVYSLGATIYEVLALRPPFRGKDNEDTISQIIQRDPPEPRSIDPRVPRDLETIVLKCLRKEAADRYGTAEALGQDLRRFVRGDAIEARPQAAWEKLRRCVWRQRLRLAAVGGALLFLLAVVLLALNQHQRARERDETRYRELVVRAVGSLELGGFAEPIVNRNEQRSAACFYRYLYLSEPGSPEEDPSARRALGALQDLEEAIRLFPRLPDARYHLARGSWLLGRRDEALRMAEEALSLAPRFTPLWTLKAAILAQEGKTDLARREMEAPRRLGGAPWAEPWQRAHEAGKRGDWAAAAEALGELLLREKSGEESYTAAALELRLARGLTYLQAGEFEKARLDLAMAHDRWPEALAPAYLIGRTFVREGKRDLAAAWFSEYQRLTRRGDAEIFRFLLDLMNKDFETLILWVDAMRPGPVRDRVLACILLESRRVRQALAVALQSLEKRPEDPVDLALLALVKSYTQGGTQEAQALLARVQNTAPFNATVCAIAAAANGGFANHVERERWGRLLLELDPGSGVALDNIADSLQAQGKPDEAVALLEEARMTNPLSLSPGAYTILGFIHLLRRDLAAAERELRRGLELDPEDYFILSNLGEIQHARGLGEEAEVLYRKAMRLWPLFYHAPGRLAVLLEEEGRFAELPAVILRALKDQNDHMGDVLRNVHRCLQDSLRWRPRLAPAPELDEIAMALEASLAGGVCPPRFLQSLALVLLHAPQRKDLDRSLELALKAREQAPADPEACATLGSVQAARAELAEAIRTLEGATGLAGVPLLQLEDYRRSYLPSLASYASADWAIEGMRREVLIPEGALWRYTVATAGEPVPGWAELGFRDDAWSEGPSGFGYGGGDDATVLEPRRDEAVHVRHVFTVARPQRYQVLVLSLQVDGAYEVWLNGREVARGTADAGGRMRRKPHVFVETAIETSVLREGENVLAIRARDAALWGRGLSLVPVLTAEVERDRTAELEVRERFAAVAGGEEERRILAYLDARLLERDGRPEAATKSYSELSAAERTQAEPHLRHVECLLARGEAAAAEAHLQEVLAGGLDRAEVWDLWARVAFRDLGWSAAELLDRLPAVDSARARDLLWVLKRLEADGAIRINCGGEQYASAGGLGWGADGFFSSGGKEQSDNDFVRVAGTDDPPLFKVARWFAPLGAGLPGYRLPLPRGRYRVTLHFAEINFDYQGPGRRVFDVIVEGKPVLEGYDAVARVGFATADVVSCEPVEVKDGRLEIEFVHRVRNPLVSAIEIKRVD